MSSRTWTDHLGRTYTYEPYEAAPIAGIQVALSEASAFAVAEASRAIGTVPRLPLAGTASVIYRSEASASSIIEDLAVGPRRILEAQIADPGELRDPIAERIVGNLEGLRDALATPYPATVDDILRWHRILMAGHPRMAMEDIGVLRRKQNWIGGDGFGPRNAAFIPPPPEDVPGLLEDLDPISRAHGCGAGRPSIDRACAVRGDPSVHRWQWTGGSHAAATRPDPSDGSARSHPRLSPVEPRQGSIHRGPSALPVRGVGSLDRIRRRVDGPRRRMDHLGRGPGEPPTR